MGQGRDRIAILHLMDGVVVLGTVAESSSSTSTNTAVSTTTTTATVASGTWRCRIFDTASPLRIPKADRHQPGWVDRRVRPADAPGGPRPGRPRPVVLTKENGGWAGEGRYGSFKARHRLPRSGDKFFGGTSCSGARTGPPRWWSRPASSGPHRSTTSTDAARGATPSSITSGCRPGCRCPSGCPRSGPSGWRWTPKRTRAIRAMFGQ